MNNSTFEQPLPNRFKASMSCGYLLGSDNPKPFELLQVAPAGSLSSTAVDMSHFMIMHLQKGLYKGIRILKPETSIQMQARQKGWPKAINAMCLGFYEQSRNGYRIIGHEGNTVLFHSNIYLILDANTGLFISYNSAGDSKLDLRDNLFNKFMDRYFPEDSKNEAKLPIESSNIQHVIGTYGPSRCCETTFLRIFKLFQEIKVVDNFEEHSISITGFNGLNQKPLHFKEIEPLIFQEVDGKAKIAFVQDVKGHRIAHINYDIHYPSVAFQEVDTIFDKQSFNFILLGFSLSVLMCTIVAWPISAVIRKYSKKSLILSPNEKKLRILVYFICLSFLSYIVGMIVFVSMLSDFSILSERSDIYLRMLQLLALIGILGSFVVIYNSIKYWADKQECVWKKLWNTFLAIACVGFSWFIYHWNLLDFSLKY